MRVVIFFLLFVMAETSFASGYSGDLFELKSNFSKKLFHLDVQIKDENGKFSSLVELSF